MGAIWYIDFVMIIPFSRASGLVVIALVACWFPANAQALEKQAFYVGFDASHAWFREFGDDTSAYIVRAGFQPSRHYAIEIGQLAFFDMRNRFDGAAGEEVDIRIKDGGVFSLSVLGNYPLGRRWSVQGRLGLSLWSVFYELQSSTFPGIITNRKDDDQGLSVGLGLIYDLNRLIGIHAGLDYFPFQPSIPFYGEGKESVPVLSLGIRVRPL